MRLCFAQDAHCVGGPDRSLVEDEMTASGRHINIGNVPVGRQRDEQAHFALYSATDRFRGVVEVLRQFFLRKLDGLFFRCQTSVLGRFFGRLWQDGRRSLFSVQCVFQHGVVRRYLRSGR